MSAFDSGGRGNGGKKGGGKPLGPGATTWDNWQAQGLPLPPIFRKFSGSKRIHDAEWVVPRIQRHLELHPEPSAVPTQAKAGGASVQRKTVFREEEKSEAPAPEAEEQVAEETASEKAADGEASAPDGTDAKADDASTAGEEKTTEANGADDEKPDENESAAEPVANNDEDQTEEKNEDGGEAATAPADETEEVQRKDQGGGEAAGGVKIPEGGGTPLPGGIKSKMQKKLGTDLSDVKVHTGGESSKASEDLSAKAFTVGADVHFNEGQFDPSSNEGEKLLAHELTHVAQNKKGGVQRKEAEEGEPVEGAEGEQLEVSDPDEPAEQEADAKAEEIVEGSDDQAASGEGKDDEGSTDPEGTGESEEATAEAPPAAVATKRIQRHTTAAPPPAAAGAPAATDNAVTQLKPLLKNNEADARILGAATGTLEKKKLACAAVGSVLNAQAVADLLGMPLEPDKIVALSRISGRDANYIKDLAKLITGTLTVADAVQFANGMPKISVDDIKTLTSISGRDMAASHALHGIVDATLTVAEVAKFAAHARALPPADITKMKSIVRGLDFAFSLLQHTEFTVDDLVKFANDAPQLTEAEIGQLKAVARGPAFAHKLHALKDDKFTIPELVKRANASPTIDETQIAKLKGITGPATLADDLHPLIDGTFTAEELVKFSNDSPKLTAAEIATLKTVARGVALAHKLQPLKTDGYSVDDLVRLANDAPIIDEVAIGKLKSTGRGPAFAHAIHPAVTGSRTADEVANLGKVAALQATDVVTLAAVASRKGDFLVGVAAGVKSPRTAADVAALAGVATLTSASDVVTLANIAGRDGAYLLAIAPAVVAPRTADEVAALAAPALSLNAEDVLALARVAGRNGTYLTAVAAAVKSSFTAVDAAELSATTFNLDASDIVALSQIAGRDAAYLKAIAPAIVKGTRPVAQVAALAQTVLELSSDDVRTIAGIARDGDYVRKLAGGKKQGRPAPDLKQLAEKAPALTADDVLCLSNVTACDTSFLLQIIDEVKGSRTAAQIAALAQIVDLSAADIKKLAAVTSRSGDDLSVIARGRNGRSGDDASQIAALSITREEVLALLGLPAARTIDDLKKLVAEKKERSVADMVALVRSDPRTVDEIIAANATPAGATGAADPAAKKKVKFEPILKQAAMTGGNEPVEVKPSAPDGKAELWIGGKKGAGAVTAVKDGDISKAKNAAGANAVRETMATLDAAAPAIAAVTVNGGEVDEDKPAVLQAKCDEVATAVGALGTKLKVATLADAVAKKKTEKQSTVQFDMMDLSTAKAPYAAKFKAEMVSQIAQQEAGCNELTLDNWIINRQKFSPDEKLSELDLSAKQIILDELKSRSEKGLKGAKKKLDNRKAARLAAEQALAALQAADGATPDQILEAMKTAKEKAADERELQAELQGFLDSLPEVATVRAGGETDGGRLSGPGGREDGQAKFARDHAAAKQALIDRLNPSHPDHALVAGWEGIVSQVGDLAVLHDPDQIAGGNGAIPDAPELDPVDPPGPAAKQAEIDAYNTYLTAVKNHLGSKDVNSSLGSQWTKVAEGKIKSRIQELHDDVVGNPSHTQENYGIRTMNVKFIPPA